MESDDDCITQNRTFIFADAHLFERSPNYIIDLVDFIPALRDDHAGLTLFGQFQIPRGKFLMLIGQRALLDDVQLVQPVE